MILVLLVGPELISQDLRFNAMPLYFSRPVRRIDYFAGKLGVIAVFLGRRHDRPGAPGLRAWVWRSASIPLVVRDTWRLLVALAGLRRDRRGLGGHADAGDLVAVAELAVRGGDVDRALGRQRRGLDACSTRPSTSDWCPLVSYTGNLSRVRDALLDSPSRLGRRSPRSSRPGRTSFATRPCPSPGRPAPGRRRFPLRSGPAPPAPPAAGRALVGRRMPSAMGKTASYPWQWSAGVLAGLAALSVWILATRVRSLDRLR